jgi:hypothetical protein
MVLTVFLKTGSFAAIRLSRTAPAFCLAAIAAFVMASATPAEAQSRHRLKAAERSKKDQGPPIPPGPLHLIVSLKNQHATLYANGTPVARAPISSGTASHPTPTGVFSVIQKNRHHRSNIYSGAPMPFMQRLTWSGIALHQGQLPGYPASHGCIRLPGDFANFLWRTTKLGARVIVSRDDVEPVEIAHAKLFQPKPPVITADISKLRRSIDAEMAVNTATATATDATATDRPASETEIAKADSTAKTTDGVSDISAVAQIDIPVPILASFFDTLDAKAKKPAPAGPVSIFISRKDKQLYVRQGFQPLFNAPVTIRDENAIFGTHVFTALQKANGAADLRWIAVTMPPEIAKAERKIAERKPDVVYRYDYYGRRIPVRMKAAQPAKPVEPQVPTPAAASVLERIELPQDLVARISEYVTAGATLIVSDHGLGHETGAYTDFIVLTR